MKEPKKEEPNLNPEISNDPRIRFDNELGCYVMTGEDGINLVWDSTKLAWFPMFQEDLISQQQSIYNHENSALPTDLTQEKTEKEAPEKKKKVKTGPVVKFSESSIYITRLPLDTTVDEVEEYFKKCGVIFPDLDTGKPRIKLYTDEETGQLKGDCLLSYFKPESVDLAITILDETEFRPGHIIKIEKAKFDPKNTKEQPQRFSNPFGNKERKRKMEAQIKRVQKQLDWNDRSLNDKRAKKAARTVIMKHMFRPREFEQDPSLILDLKEEIRDECEKLGSVTTVVVYDKNPDGVVAVRFGDELSAHTCVKLNNGRFFDGRQLEASIYDGVTKYGMTDRQETEEDEKIRLEKYEKWLESGGKEEMPQPPPDDADEISNESDEELVNYASDLLEGEIGSSLFGAIRDSETPKPEYPKIFDPEEKYFEEEDEEEQNVESDEPVNKKPRNL